MSDGSDNGQGDPTEGMGGQVPVLEVVEAGQEEETIRALEELPDALPVLPLRETVAYPDTLSPLGVGQERSIKLVDDVLAANRMLVMVASREPEDETPGPEQLYDVGVVGVVTRMLKVPDGSIRILVQGTQRVRIGDYVAEEPYLVARSDELPDEVEDSPELEALTRNVQKTFSEIIEQIPYLPEELQLAVANVDDPSALSHLIAGALRIPTAEKEELLEEVDVGKRLRMIAKILARELEVIQLGLDRLHLLPQEELPLALVDRLLYLGLDLGPELDHLEFAGEDLGDHPQPRADVELLEQLLQRPDR
ncbi:MAG: LON peptidase substrate-binding domain-containing protein, partial [Solirubrobacterales bacterium]